MSTNELQPTLRQRLIDFITKFNLYKDEENLSLADQLLSTRLYIILLSIALFILIVFTSLSIQTRIVTIKSPSQIKFEQLSNKYPSTFSCLCSQTTIPHKQFISFAPQYHQVCTSEFISQEWISSLFHNNINDYHPLDYRVIASAQFQVLALFCRTAQQLTSNAIKQFDASLLISKQTLFRTTFNMKIAALIDELIAKTMIDYHYTDRLLSTIISESHVISALRTNFYMKSDTELFDECSCEINFDCTFPSGFYNISKPMVPLDEIFQYNLSPVVFIPGMKTGCLPQNSLLQSTLECFFDQQCLDMIIAFTGGLSTISPLNRTAANQSHININSTIDIIFNKMMMESWHNTSSFPDYFRICAPSECTYSYNERLSIIYIVTTLVGLIGGLNVVVKIISPLIVALIIRPFQSKCYPQYHDDDDDVVVTNDSAVKLSVRKRIIHLLIQIREKLLTYNLFRKTLIDPQHGIYSTRVYVVLLVISVIILTIYSFIIVHIQTVTIQNPTLEQFEKLHIQYPKVSCPCQHLSTPFSNIISSQPRFHPICSSTFIDKNRWLKYWPLIPINQSNEEMYEFDFRRMGITFFNFVQSFCNMTSSLVINALNIFKSVQLFSIQAITQEEFESQMNSVYISFYLQMRLSFISFRDFVYTNIRQNQFIIDLSTNAIPVPLTVNDSLLFKFILIEYFQQNSLCSCRSSRSCSKSQGFYCSSETCHQPNSIPNQTIPGLILACYTFESFLSSTLECFFNQTCVQMLIDWRLFDYTDTYSPINFTNITALDVNALNFFYIDMTLNQIIQELFVEDWASDVNYTAAYVECNPAVCTYIITERYQLIYVITSVIGLLGGLTVILDISIPHLVKIGQLIHHYHREDRQAPQHHIHPCRLFITRVQHEFAKLNVYYRELRIEHQLLATRIYLILLILSIIIVSLFMGLTQQVHTITINTPTISEFNSLYSRYSNRLSCPCTTIAILYPSFSDFAFINHPLCSHLSSASSKWTFPSYINNTWNDLDRFLLITQFRLLASICDQVENEIYFSRLKFYGERFISFETESKESFQSQINSTISLFIEETINNFRHSLALISDTFRANQLQNLYMTNWQANFSTVTENDILHSIPVSYNNGTCICATSMSNCSRSLSFQDFNNNIISIAGIVGGCLPIDGVRQSTLECFFNQSCLTQLNILLNSSIPILSVNSTRFRSMTTQIGTFIDELFIESWVISINYTRYYNKCAPSICEYSYVTRNDIIYILTTLLGLYGGLTIALQLIVWYGLCLFSWLRTRCCHQLARIEPTVASSTTIQT